MAKMPWKGFAKDPVQRMLSKLETAQVEDGRHQLAACEPGSENWGSPKPMENQFPKKSLQFLEICPSCSDAST